MSTADNSIHSSAQLIGDVRLGAGNTIGPLAVIIGPVTIGDGNWFGTGAVVGAPPEVRSWPHPHDAQNMSSGNGITIGDRNVFREYAQVHQGWHAVTTVGNDNFVMNQVYVAHDCVLGNGVTLASSVLLAGHVHVADSANLGLGASVHQQRFVGRGAMVGMGAVVTRDVPPWAKSFGSPATLRGANTVGMERAGIPQEAVVQVADLYSRVDGSAELESLDHPALAAGVAEWLRRHGGE